MTTETTRTIKLGDKVIARGYDVQTGTVINISTVFGGTSLEYQVEWNGNDAHRIQWYEAHELERM